MTCIQLAYDAGVWSFHTKARFRGGSMLIGSSIVRPRTCISIREMLTRWHSFLEHLAGTIDGVCRVQERQHREEFVICHVVEFEHRGRKINVHSSSFNKQTFLSNSCHKNLDKPCNQSKFMTWFIMTWAFEILPSEEPHFLGRWTDVSRNSSNEVWTRASLKKMVWLVRIGVVWSDPTAGILTICRCKMWFTLAESWPRLNRELATYHHELTPFLEMLSLFDTPSFMQLWSSKIRLYCTVKLAFRKVRTVLSKDAAGQGYRHCMVGNKPTLWSMCSAENSISHSINDQVLISVLFLMVRHEQVTRLLCALWDCLDILGCNIENTYSGRSIHSFLLRRATILMLLRLVRFLWFSKHSLLVCWW